MSLPFVELNLRSLVAEGSRALAPSPPGTLPIAELLGGGCGRSQFRSQPQAEREDVPMGEAPMGEDQLETGPSPGGVSREG